MSLTDEQIERYSRQIILPEVGGRGQESLLRARVRVARELAPWAARYLGAAGVGELELEGSEAELVAALRRLNPDCHVCRVGEPQASSRQPTVVLIAGEAAEAELRSAWEAGVPAVAVDLEAATVTALSSADSASACPACLARRSDAPAPPSARTGATAFLATLAATEAIKMILAVGAPLYGRRLFYDAGAASIRVEAAPCRPNCGRA